MARPSAASRAGTAPPATSDCAAAGARDRSARQAAAAARASGPPGADDAVARTAAHLVSKADAKTCAQWRIVSRSGPDRRAVPPSARQDGGGVLAQRARTVAWTARTSAAKWPASTYARRAKRSRHRWSVDPPGRSRHLATWRGRSVRRCGSMWSRGSATSRDTSHASTASHFAGPTPAALGAARAASTARHLALRGPDASSHWRLRSPSKRARCRWLAPRFACAMTDAAS